MRFALAGMFVRIRYRIKSSGMKWTAARQPFQREPHSAPRAKLRDRFVRVLRASRLEFAGRGHQRRDTRLISAQRKEQRARRDSTAAVHRSALRSSAVNSAASREYSLRAVEARG